LKQFGGFCFKKWNGWRAVLSRGTFNDAAISKVEIRTRHVGFNILAKYSAEMKEPATSGLLNSMISDVTIRLPMNFGQIDIRIS
jgi:hypothetical protein